MRTQEDADRKKAWELAVAVARIERRREIVWGALAAVYGDATMTEADALLQALEDRHGRVVVS